VSAVHGLREALREARAASLVSHHNVVRVHDVLLTDQGAWIVLEALGGMSLSLAIRRERRLAVPHVARIGLAVLDALEAVHDAGLVHRDVKPGNIQLTERDRVVLTDFGISSPRTPATGPRPAVVYGSRPYLAPESLRRGEFGPATDLFALGVTLFKAVEGHLPDSGATLTHGRAMGDVVEGLLASDPLWRSDPGAARDGLRPLAAS
jgi:serine/threonine protein kinase